MTTLRDTLPRRSQTADWSFYISNVGFAAPAPLPSISRSTVWPFHGQLIFCTAPRSLKVPASAAAYGMEVVLLSEYGSYNLIIVISECVADHENGIILGADTARVLPSAS